MNSVTFSKLQSTKTRELPDILKNWKNYNEKSIVLTYLEAKRRNIPFADDMQNDVNEFLAAKQLSETEMQKLFNIENGVDSYDEFFRKMTTPVITEESERLKKLKIQQHQKAFKKEKEDGAKDILIGGIVFVVGVIICIATLKSGKGYITYGAIIYGLFRLINGLTKL